MSVKLDLTNLTEEQAEQAAAIPKSLERMRSFIEEYSVIEPLYDLYDGEDIESLEVYSGMTFEQLESVTIADAYYAILKNVQAISEHFNIPMEEVVEKGLESVTWYKGALRDAFRPAPIVIPKTRQPKHFISPKDKITNKFFEGALPIGSKGVLVGTEGRKSKKELTAVVSIDFEELPNVHISKIITPQDREVHDAIVTLYVDGENEYMTPLMIYRTMTGNPKAELTEKKAKDISDSVTKCSMTRIFIDSNEEAGAFGMERVEYEGSLLFAEKINGSHKGKINEWIHILKTPILYQYADNKGQIARSPIELLNTPVNKNDEAIILQGYLLRRILAMQGSKLSRNIVYETVYKYLDISAVSAGALRKKQTKVRDTAKKILDDWVTKKFIRSYKENKKGNSIVSLTVEF